MGELRLEDLELLKPKVPRSHRKLTAKTITKEDLAERLITKWLDRKLSAGDLLKLNDRICALLGIKLQLGEEVDDRLTTRPWNRSSRSGSSKGDLDQEERRMVESLLGHCQDGKVKIIDCCSLARGNGPSGIALP
mgnify:CR=1 FL=1